MRAAILADIHGNLEAFRAVLDDIDQHGGADEVWCLGDLVGYGPNPREVIALLREYPHVCVAGNHDLAATGKIDTSFFNSRAAEAAHWTSDQLTGVETGYLNELPLRITKGDFSLVHGSPRNPVWEYLVSEPVALANLEHFETPYCLVGHSHLPFICELIETSVRCIFRPFPIGVPVELGEERLIINPGGVGQPRDGDPRSSYALYDGASGTICHYRVPYRIPTTQEKMRRAGLPDYLVNRLSQGL